nr:hypothetical protein CFP56_36250 [Quercus suber]
MSLRFSSSLLISPSWTWCVSAAAGEVYLCSISTCSHELLWSLLQMLGGRRDKSETVYNQVGYQREYRWMPPYSYVTSLCDVDLALAVGDPTRLHSAKLDPRLSLPTGHPTLNPLAPSASFPRPDSLPTSKTSPPGPNLPRSTLDAGPAIHRLLDGRDDLLDGGVARWPDLGAEHERDAGGAVDGPERWRGRLQQRGQDGLEGAHRAVAAVAAEGRGRVRVQGEVQVALREEGAGGRVARGDAGDAGFVGGRREEGQVAGGLAERCQDAGLDPDVQGRGGRALEQQARPVEPRAVGPGGAGLEEQRVAEARDDRGAGVGGLAALRAELDQVGHEEVVAGAGGVVEEGSAEDEQGIVSGRARDRLSFRPIMGKQTSDRDDAPQRDRVLALDEDGLVVLIEALQDLLRSQLRQQILDVVVQADPAVVHHLQHRDRGQQFRLRGHLEQRVGLDRRRIVAG